MVICCETLIEFSGEGTIPSTNEDFGTQTFDGVLAGERLLNLSCSDKVLRMNVLGMQGKMSQIQINDSKMEFIYFLV